MTEERTDATERGCLIAEGLAKSMAELTESIGQLLGTIRTIRRMHEEHREANP